ncbi:MAG: MarR family transcriptional regulator [Candidatus Lokiarchaeota archaeon]|nr:MarR family transcriptional regulator [Candidatus Lokiarchaeota archaeon]
MTTLKEQRKAGFLISQIQQISNRIFNKKLKENDIKNITRSKGRIMFTLWKEDNITLKELAKRTSLSKSNISMILDKMEKEGTILRLNSPNNRREILIKLLNQGIDDLNKKYLKISIEMNELFFQGFKNEDINLFEEYLEKILENIKKYNLNKSN